MVLDTEALQVDSFETTAAPREVRGTVRAADGDSYVHWCVAEPGWTDGCTTTACGGPTVETCEGNMCPTATVQVTV
jgi:hypothetical protein